MKTRKIIIVLGGACLLAVSNSSVAQQSNTDAFGKGSNVINVGVGLGGDYGYINSYYSSTPNIVLSYDNGTFGNVGPGTISLGGLLSYKGVSYSSLDKFGYAYNENWHYYIIGIRSAYHWNFTNSSRFDPYLGLMLAYYDITNNFSFNDPHFEGIEYPYNSIYSSYTALSLYLGARYYLSNTVGIWLELGYGYSNVAAGVSFKL